MSDVIEIGTHRLFWKPEVGGEGAHGTVWLAPLDAGETLEDAEDLATCVAVGPECLDELADGLRCAKRWYGQPVPDEPELDAFRLGVACVVLGVSLDRLGGGARRPDLTLDGKPLRASAAAKVERAVRAAIGG